MKTQTRGTATTHFRRPDEAPYRADERGRTTILIGGLTWRHHELARAVLEGLGHRCEVLPAPNLEAFQYGKDNCNNGECNPVYFMVGGVIQHLMRKQAQGLSPSELRERFVYFTVGSCGPCRHGMYEAEYRSALANAGFPGFRIPLLVQSKGLYGQREDPGLEYTLDFSILGLAALFLGDLLEDVEYRTRPYEVNPGETDAVVRWCVERLGGVLREWRLRELLEDAPGPLARLLSRHAGARDAARALAKLHDFLSDPTFRSALRECRERIAAIEIDPLRLKPLVKIVGEFYSQTTESLGNYGMFAFLEREGAEVAPSQVAGWVTYLLFQAGEHWRARRGLRAPRPGARGWGLHRRLGNALDHARWAALFWLGERGCAAVYERLRRALGGVAHELASQREIARLARPFYNTLIKGGEGHQEVGKTLHYAGSGRCHMVLSLKPFGCMPSQCSDGVQSAVLGRHPDFLFLPVETSGDGEVHAQSRVQMALSEAKARARAELDAAVASSGLTLDDVRRYLTENPELRRAGYPLPGRPGIAGRAASLVLHVAERTAAAPRRALHRSEPTSWPTVTLSRECGR